MLNGLPFFLRLGDTNHELNNEINRQHPQLAFQRYILASTVHSRRFKLNQPFLVRLPSDRRFAYSREVCLQSARAVISINRQLQNDKACPASSRLTTFLHTFFLATAVLVMDLCINKSEATDDGRQEVKDACHVLESAEGNASPVSSGFLASLTVILQKYRVQISPDTTATTVSSLTIPVPDHGGAQSVSGPEGPVLSGSSFHGACDIDGLCRGLIGIDGHDATSWDNLFSTLDAEF